MRLAWWAHLLAVAIMGAVTVEAQDTGSGSIGPIIGVQVRVAHREPVFGGLARFGFNAGRWFLGPEYGLVQGSETRTRLAGLLVRFSGRGDRVRPFLVAGAGSYRWSTRYEYALPSGQTVEDWTGIDYFSGSLGGGVELGTRKRLNPVFEVRFHTNIQRNDVAAGARGLVTASVGLQYRW